MAVRSQDLENKGVDTSDVESKTVEVVDAPVEADEPAEAPVITENLEAAAPPLPRRSDLVTIYMIHHRTLEDGTGAIPRQSYEVPPEEAVALVNGLFASYEPVD